MGLCRRCVLTSLHRSPVVFKSFQRTWASNRTFGARQKNFWLHAKVKIISLNMSSRTTKVSLTRHPSYYHFIDKRYVSGTVHGFAARPNLAYPEVKAGYEGAFEQTIEWFQKTLPV